MGSLLRVVIPLACLWAVLSAPVSKNKSPEGEDVDVGDGKDVAKPHIEEYKRYVQQVLTVLEDHPEIRERIRGASEEDITGGKLGEELGRIAPAHIRSQLDEAKRQTIARQRLILKKRMEKDLGARRRTDSHEKEIFGEEIPEFDSNDLRQVLLARKQEMEKEDKERHGKFVKLEMSKEHQRKVLLKKMGEKDRLEAEEKHKFEQDKRKNHPKLHHPGSKSQFEEVWEEQDGLEKQDFNPRTFFQLHDTNDDGYLDPYELEALFFHEVAKIYGDEETPEMQEEIARMREHVLNEVDKDQDGLVSHDEFMKTSELKEFEEDPGWEGLDEEEQYTDEEMEEYERMLQEEMESMDAESRKMMEEERNRSEHPEDVEQQGDHGRIETQQETQHTEQQVPAQVTENHPEAQQQQQALPVEAQQHIEVQAAEAQPHQGETTEAPKPDEQHKEPDVPKPDEQHKEPEEVKQETKEHPEQPKEEEKKEEPQKTEGH